ncbi:hypothetical protein [Vibrio vulnificus]|uniref:hypothetical protein n=1 Tax=Vibrio vulnificus TaxID=672 RepID=UPI000F4D83DD|nr:hypothetical protein [Vibrio vulnificus]MCA3987364.1 hypothetical protein [Vibrio vulnificus]MCU8178692.1 hypothetical protein [Vibrio vulnificus]RPB36387.1 hypothetical protein CYV18_04645 [Vibrio vulnificus]
MARPKSYSEEELINVASELLNKGIEPRGWRIREVLGRGKTTSFDKDIKRLTESGKLPIYVKPAISTEVLPARSETEHAQLPIEIQEAYKITETELSESIYALILKLNDITACHYEQLTRTRLQSAINEKEIALEEKRLAEEQVIKTEERVRAQVANNEELELQCEELEHRYSELEQAQSNISSELMLLKRDNVKLCEDVRLYEITIHDLEEQVLSLSTANTILDTQLEERNLQSIKLEERYSDLENQLDTTKQQLTVANTRSDSIQMDLAKTDEIISSLRSELLEANNRVQVAENKTQLLSQENGHLRFVNKELSRKHGGLVELQ